MKDTEDLVNVVFVRFTDKLDYKSVVNSFYIKKFLESVYGDFPNPISPRAFTFEKDVLCKFTQDEYERSKDYIIDSKTMPSLINESYGGHLDLVEFESDFLLDDHLVVVNDGDKVLGVFATEDDFRHIIDEL